MAQLVKKPPAIRKTWVQALGRENPLEKGKAICPVFWPGEFHGVHSAWGCKESDSTEQLSLSYLNGLVVFPSFFNLSLNFAMSMISATVGSGLFLLTV